MGGVVRLVLNGPRKGKRRATSAEASSLANPLGCKAPDWFQELED